ncbi:MULTISPECIES: hypothetical protein [Streptomyces]|uniref:hypothetical protein n=1 Tax=Streptomyces TaxID=1883 RepID=UPI001674D9A8|nr:MULTISPECIES: hypothetical protein [Streptomyces]MBD3577026.1 hypothetical protein [Streptomyces sp. KD18]GGT04378.1 thioredoxin [Streptomyces toxytricini]
MSAAMDAREAGRRVDAVLDRLAADGDRKACEAAEELVRVLMDFYGAGLARITERLGAGPVSRMLGDDLVASLLALHDLHPEDVDSRIARALATLHEPVEPLGFDTATGVLRLRAASTGSGCGCGGTDALRRAAEEALAGIAPEVTAVEVEPAPPQPALLQIGRRPHAPARVP